jgi:hypothetical protein
MTFNSRFKDAIIGSIELEKRGEQVAALELLDEAIAEAIRKGDSAWIRTLCHHAAIALGEGDAITARKYATRCHSSMLQSDDEILKQGLLDLIAKNWPDLTEKQ